MSLRVIILPAVVFGVAMVAVTTLRPREPPSMNINIPVSEAGLGAVAIAQETPPAPQPAVPTPFSDKSRVAVARDAYLDAAIDTTDQQLAMMVCVRRNYFTAKAREWQRQTGGNVEKWLLERLSAIKGDSAKDSNTFTGLDGSPDQFQNAKTYAFDALALTSALQELYQGKSSQDCLIQFGESYQAIDKFQNEANTYRALLEKRQQEIVGGQNVQP